MSVNVIVIRMNDALCLEALVVVATNEEVIARAVSDC